MTRRQTYFFAAVLALLAGAARGEGEPVTPQNDVIKLFDGHSLDGCYVWIKGHGRRDPDRVFSVADGLIHVTGDGLGALVTERAYRDYHLVLEFRWGERTWRDRKNAARDSGLLLHSNGADGGHDDIWMPSIEVQIIEGGVGDVLGVAGRGVDDRPVPITYTCEVDLDRDGEPVWKAGAQRKTFATADLRRVNWFGRAVDWTDTKGFRGPEDVDGPLGQWTRIDVRCAGDRLEAYVNGVKVNEAFDVYPRSGKLQLQTELAEIDFRRWELWPLAKAPKPAPAEQDSRSSALGGKR